MQVEIYSHSVYVDWSVRSFLNVEDMPSEGMMSPHVVHSGHNHTTENCKHGSIENRFSKPPKSLFRIGSLVTFKLRKRGAEYFDFYAGRIKGLTKKKITVHLLVVDGDEENFHVDYPSERFELWGSSEADLVVKALDARCGRAFVHSVTPFVYNNRVYPHGCCDVLLDATPKTTYPVPKEEKKAPAKKKRPAPAETPAVVKQEPSKKQRLKKKPLPPSHDIRGFFVSAKNEDDARAVVDP